MATVVDELVLQLGLDSTKFTQGQREAMDSLRRMQYDLDRGGKAAEAQGVKLGNLFSTIKGGAVGVLAAFGGGEVAAFVDKIAHMDNAAGRMAKTIGMSVQELSVWQGMIRQIGGDAGSATSSLGGLQSAITNMLQGGGMLDPGAMFVLNQIGGVRGKNPGQIMRELAAHYAGEIGAGRETPTGAAAMLGRLPGMNKDMIDLLLKGPEALAKYEAEVRRIGAATGDSAANAAEYVQKLNALALAWENLGRKVIPILTMITNLLSKLLPGSGTSAEASQAAKSMSYSMPGLPKWSAFSLKAGAGSASPETQKLMDALGGVSGIKQVTALNDLYHQFLGGGHPAGRALDLTVTDPAQAEVVAAAIRAKLSELGIDASVINEYDPAKRSPNATGGHIHVGMRQRMSSLGPIGAGAAAARSSVSNRGGDVNSSSAYVDKVIVQTQVTDADGFARAVVPAMQRFAKAMPGNYAQV